MTPPIRVLVVDDSSVVRRILSDLINGQPDMTVVGTAQHGQRALDQLDLVKPDIITLDVEMPVMDGLATLTALRARGSRVPVIMCSTLTARGGATTLDALSKGATDYVTKPEAVAGSPGAAAQSLSDTLLPKIRGLAGRGRAAPSAMPLPPLKVAPLGLQFPVQAVAIGVSTGGPNALNALLPALGKDWSVPVFITQHMPPLFTRMLAERLAQLSGLRVAEATDGVAVEPGTVWVAPGDFHMTAERVGLQTRLRLTQGPPENSCRPAVDPMLRSLAKIYGKNLLTVVMTGMGGDGAKGAADVAQQGGRVWVQDESTSVVWGMPGATVATGVVERVVALPELAGLLRRAVGLK